MSARARHADDARWRSPCAAAGRRSCGGGHRSSSGVSVAACRRRRWTLRLTAAMSRKASERTRATGASSSSHSSRRSVTASTARGLAHVLTGVTNFTASRSLKASSSSGPSARRTASGSQLPRRRATRRLARRRLVRGAGTQEVERGVDLGHPPRGLVPPTLVGMPALGELAVGRSDLLVTRHRGNSENRVRIHPRHSDGGSATFQADGTYRRARPGTDGP